MELDWNNLRPHHNSRRIGFEELCCQLAKKLDMPTDSVWTRNDTPDGGVEGFWTLPDGSQLAWQAKYFLKRPTANQWRQVEKSFDNALLKYNKLTKYYICMPLDRANPKKDKEEWFMDAWEKQVDKWTKKALKEGRKVTFEYWGEHEIVTILAEEKHRGRVNFWFDEELFTMPWFKEQRQKAVKIAGLRYSPDLNIELNIAKVFDAFGETKDFRENLKKIISKVVEKTTKLRRNIDSCPFKKRISCALMLCDQVVEKLDRLVNDRAINLQIIKKKTSKAMQFMRDVKWTAYRHNKQERYNYVVHLLNECSAQMADVHYYVSDVKFKVFFENKMVLIGEAGTGKTHLLCDVLERRIDREMPTVLLFGQQFTSGPIWPQVCGQLGLSTGTSPKDFLGMLEACADLHQTKFVILIDALNETDPCRLWTNNLLGILSDISDTNNVKLAFSIRTPFVPVILPENLQEQIPIVHHSGFTEVVHEVIPRFFAAYGIELLDRPILHPEFNNPLFLKVYCEGHRNAQLNTVKRGLNSITKIFDFFIDSVEKKLAKENAPHFDKHLRIVKQSVDKLAGEMAAERNDALDYSLAEQVIKQLWPSNMQAVQTLISENILIKSIKYKRENDDYTCCEVVRFTYQRLSDHAIVAHFLRDFETLKDFRIAGKFSLFNSLVKLWIKYRIKKAFARGGRFRHFVDNEASHYEFANIIQAFCIQLPERFGLEFSDLLEESLINERMREYILESLKWRSPRTITARTNKLIKKLITSEYLVNCFLRILVELSLAEKHPLNSKYLHQFLMRLKMPRRDKLWSTFIYKEYGSEASYITTIVEWCSNPKLNKLIQRNVKIEYAKVLAWFFTTSHRFLRDRATKGLVALMKDDVDLMIRLLKEFERVDDPYVLERIYAAAYGAVLRTNEYDAAIHLGQFVYATVFANQEPPTNISLREYARGIVEYALRLDPSLDIKPEELLPPFKSVWPTDLPSVEEAKDALIATCSNKEAKSATGSIDFSVTSDDFFRYVIASNISHEWTSRKLGVERPPTNKEVFDDFIKSLTKSQKEKLNEYKEALRASWRHTLSYDDQGQVVSLWQHEINEELEKSRSNFLNVLDNIQHEAFENTIDAFIRDTRLLYEKDYFDLDIAKAFILHKILEYGWSGDLFGYFDTRIYREHIGRDAYKSERLGKKYQWIALKELLARISDNFEYSADFGRRHKFLGCLESHDIRDIDPSFLLRKTKQQSWETARENWWSPFASINFRNIQDDAEWLASGADLPALDKMICLSWRNRQWLNLWIYLPYYEEIPYRVDPETYRRRKVWLKLVSYLVKNDDADAIFNWIKNENFWGGRMPDATHWYGAFYGEYYNSSAYEYMTSDWIEYDNICRHSTFKGIVTTEEYYCETGTFDCSLDKTMSILLPCRKLMQGMNLNHRIKEGQCYSKSGDLVALDPSVQESGCGSLIFVRDKLNKFLSENNYCILWKLLGQKTIAVSSYSDHRPLKGSAIINAAALLRGEELICSMPLLKIENL